MSIHILAHNRRYYLNLHKPVQRGKTSRDVSVWTRLVELDFIRSRQAIGYWNTLKEKRKRLFA
jgi:hypothetical protein